MVRFRIGRRGKKGQALPGAHIVIGLGNPGPHYAGHRHNVGARVAERVAKSLRLPMTQRDKLAVSGQGETPYGPVVVARPQTFMNESGRAAAALLKQHDAEPGALILIVDELDLEVGRLRIRAHGSDGGQKGMRSIKQVIGTTEFPRVRIGVGRPYVGGEPSRHPDVVADHLLANPIPAEAQALHEAEQRAAEAVIAILRDGVDAAMNAYNVDGNG
jgi:PTH1 family peptidyl-tRNA hydrolase